jgi:outer membrane autotransporter protein
MLNRSKLCLSVESDTNQHFFWDTHQTAAGFDLYARYITKLLSAQDEIPLQANVLRGASDGFTFSVFSRLDATRFRNAGTERSSQTPWSVYVSGFYTGAADPMATSSPTEQRQQNVWGDAPGGSIGFDYRFAPGLLGGLAFSYGSSSSFGQNNGRVTATLPQFAGYLSASGAGWFADAVLTGGPAFLDITRPGVIDTLRASAAGSVFSAGVQGGYLFDLAAAKVGPVGRLTYGRVTIGQYTESGDPVLTNVVHDQQVGSLVGNLGVQVRFPFNIGTLVINPFVEVRAEHDFLASSRWIVAEETAALGLPIWTRAQGSDTGVYGRVTAGASLSVSRNLDFFLASDSTFSHAGGDLWRTTAGLQYRF